MMFKESIAAIAFSPAAEATAGVLVVALVLIVVLTLKMRQPRVKAQRSSEYVRKIRTAPAPRRSAMVAPIEDVDMKDRLKRLTTTQELEAEDQVAYATRLSASGGRPGAAPTPGRAGAPRSRPAVQPAPVSAADALAHQGDDATRTFDHHDAAADGDATTFFGPQGAADSDATAFFGAEGQDGDATTFFGPGGDGDSDATTFFADTDAKADATTFFGAETPDATTFFGADGAADAHDADAHVTRFFGADEETAAPAHPSRIESATHIFSRGELDEQEAGAYPSDEGRTSMLQAGTDEVDEFDVAYAAGFLATDDHAPARPTPQALDQVRASLAEVAVPGVLALSVIDGSGRVLAGETDADLTGELRALMAESGQGDSADVEQPVRLENDAEGALLLIPTGGRALLGALITEESDPHATRARLRGLAGEIGDTMRCAS